MPDLIEDGPEEDPVLQPDVEVELPGQPGLTVALLRPAHLGDAQRLGSVRQGLRGGSDGVRLRSHWGKVGNNESVESDFLSQQPSWSTGVDSLL